MSERETWTGNMAAWSFTTEKSGGTFTDGYDAEDRFRRFIQSSQSNDIYLARSDIGNISDVEINSVSNLRSYSNAHELTTVDGTTQTFDDDGNLTLSHHGITVNRDDANRLTQTVVPPTATAGIEGTNDYGYDADGKRVWKKITRSGAVAKHTVYIYAGPNCIAEYNSGALAASPEQEYVYSGGIDSLVLLSRNSDADRYVATRNQQWSITALADISNGTVQERYTYGPFGKRTILAPDGVTVRIASSYNMPYGYTSRRHDAESDLMYFRARYYDPSTGEFTSRDPLEYIDGMSMMRGYLGFENRDPAGQLSVEIVPKRSLLIRRSCGPVAQRWDFRLSEDAPCKGFVIQKVSVKCTSVECDDKCHFDIPGLGKESNRYIYFEAWNVELGDTELKPNRGNFTDTASWDPIAETKGLYTQRGELRFFCEDDSTIGGVTVSGIGDVVDDWHEPNPDDDSTFKDYGPKGCATSPGPLRSTNEDLLSRFWNDPAYNSLNTETQTRRFAGIWKCCEGSPKFARFKAHPRR